MKSLEEIFKMTREDLINYSKYTLAQEYDTNIKLSDIDSINTEILRAQVVTNVIRLNSIQERDSSCFYTKYNTTKEFSTLTSLAERNFDFTVKESCSLFRADHRDEEMRKVLSIGTYKDSGELMSAIYRVVIGALNGEETRRLVSGHGLTRNTILATKSLGVSLFKYSGFPMRQEDKAIIKVYKNMDLNTVGINGTEIDIKELYSNDYKDITLNSFCLDVSSDTYRQFRSYVNDYNSGLDYFVGTHKDKIIVMTRDFYLKDSIRVEMSLKELIATRIEYMMKVYDSSPITLSGFKNTFNEYKDELVSEITKLYNYKGVKSKNDSSWVIDDIANVSLDDSKLNTILSNSTVNFKIEREFLNMFTRNSIHDNRCGVGYNNFIRDFSKEVSEFMGVDLWKL